MQIFGIRKKYGTIVLDMKCFLKHATEHGVLCMRKGPPVRALCWHRPRMRGRGLLYVLTVWSVRRVVRRFSRKPRQL